MKAILLATGERDNLPPLMTDYPSPMLPIANRPVITYPIELMIRHQFNDIVVSLLRQSDRVEAYCETGRRWNVDFTYLLQREALGNAGAVKRAQGLLTETFLVMPGDALVDVNLSEVYAFHRAHGGIATAVLASMRGNKAENLKARLDIHSQICAIDNQQDATDLLSFAEVYIFEPEIFEYIPSHTELDLKRDVLPTLLAHDIAIHGYVMSEYCNHLDSSADYQAAQEEYLQSLNTGDGDGVETGTEVARLSHPYVEAGHAGAGVWRAPTVMIHPTAQVHGPVLLGEGCQIGRDVTIGPNAVVGSNAIIDDGATIEQSTVLPDTYIGKLLHVRGKIVNGTTLIDIQSETYVEIADRMLLGKAGKQEANAILHNLLERLIAFGMLLTLLPLLLILAALTWITSTGSIFVREPRVGRSPLGERKYGASAVGRISLLRLRTRVENGSYTTMGYWFELWGLHRLPELVNVIRGELALVGVKPLSEAELDLISEEWQRRRFDCAAGFTGRWYTEISQGGGVDEIFVIDAYQTAVQSTRDSLSQIVKTPIVWWQRRRSVFSPSQSSSAQPLLRGRLPRYVDDNPLKH